MINNNTSLQDNTFLSRNKVECGIKSNFTVFNQIVYLNCKVHPVESPDTLVGEAKFIPSRVLGLGLFHRVNNCKDGHDGVLVAYPLLF